MSEIMSLLKIMIIDAKKITEFNHYVILGGTYSSVTKKISKLFSKNIVYRELLK